MKRNRIIVLGAGFSRPAGLPLGSELFPKIYKRIEDQNGADNIFQAELERYINYREICDNVSLQIEDIDFEDFLSFLDIEFALGLKGSDTWSEDGNEAQVLAKKMIGQIIHEKTPSKENIPDLYLKFADNLMPGDFIITFNYDVLLERALEAVEKPYRLFPHRYKEIGRHSNIVDSSKDEVVVLKMHGSLDWFSRATYSKLEEEFEEKCHNFKPRDPIFEDPEVFRPEKILSGVRSDDDPLRNMYRIREVDLFYSSSEPPSAPWILSPSHAKILYVNTFRDFWYGLGQTGGWSLGLGIVGFSMPEHDEYIRQVLYSMIRNYQESWWDDEIADMKKSNVKIVDKRAEEEDKDRLRNRYNFVDWEKVELFFDGLTSETVDNFFEHTR